MKRHLATAVVVTVALVAALELGPSGSVWSAGVLAKVHQQIPCSGCHEPFAGFTSADKCVSCHQRLQPVPAEQFPGELCAGCHREHGGDEVDLATAPQSSCNGCHEAELVPLRAREPRATGGGLKPRSFHPFHGAAPPAASASHTADAHRSAACLRCHPIDVDSHAREHDAATAADCLACHAGVHGDDPSAGPSPAPSLGTRSKTTR